MTGGWEHYIACVTVGGRFYSYMHRAFFELHNSRATAAPSNLVYKPPLEDLSSTAGTPYFFLDHADTGDKRVTYCDKIPFYGWFIE